MQSDTDYLRTRIEQERDAASRATDQRVRGRHLELAAAYAFRLRQIDVHEGRAAMRLVEAV